MAGIEIDFLPVSDTSRNGDAIAMRVGNWPYTDIIVVDGGSSSAGDGVVSHINSVFDNPTTIKHVVCTHQDSDHASGLRRVLENFEVENLWVHQPWLHAAELVPAFKYRWTVEGLAKHLRNDAFPIVADLCDIAEANGVTLREPFQGQQIGPLTVLAPNKARFLALVPTMDQTPAARQVVADAATFAGLFKALREAVLNKLEGWGLETLATPDANATSVTNQSSVVMLGDFGGCRILLTADAGVAALEDAVRGAYLMSLNIQSPDLVQVPHHGSRRNVSPAILDTILGAKLDSQGVRRGYAISSVSSGAPEFPRKVVENAFKRRGYDCCVTRDKWLNWTFGVPRRAGMNPVEVSPFHWLVEE